MSNSTSHHTPAASGTHRGPAERRAARASLELAEPQIAGALAVFPVLGPEAAAPFASLVAALAAGASVKEVDAAGSVGDLVVTNPTGVTVLCFEGEEVRGARQDRTFDVAVLVPARGRVTVPVSCVEQGRWEGARGAEPLEAAPSAPDPSLRRAKRRSLVADAGSRSLRASQGVVWSAVADRLTARRAASPTAALRDAYDGADIDAMTAAVRPVPGQIGALATVAGRPVALDIAARADVLADLLAPLARGYALEAGGAEPGRPDTEAARAFLLSALGAERPTAPTPGLGRGFELRAEGLVGGGIERDGELVALSAFPLRRGRPGPAGAARVAPPSRRRPRRRPPR